MALLGFKPDFRNGVIVCVFDVFAVLRTFFSRAFVCVRERECMRERERERERERKRVCVFVCARTAVCLLRVCLHCMHELLSVQASNIHTT